MTTTELITSEKARHTQSLLNCAYDVFSEELSSNKNLPSMKWKEEEGAISIYLLCNSEKNRKMVLFFEEMIAYWLVPNHPLNILSSRNIVFRHSDGPHPFFFIELLIEVLDEKALKLVRNQLPAVAREVQLGVLSSGHAKNILKMKRLSLEGKTIFIYESLINLMRRWPKRFNDHVFKELQQFLVHSREDFREIRHASHHVRIICTHYLYRKAIERKIKASPYQRHLYLKLFKSELHYPFGLKKVTGIAIVLNSLRDHECFELKHILKAIHNILPEAKVQANSYYIHKSESGVLSAYLEIDQVENLNTLREKLPSELKKSIEYLSHSLFKPRNEEELIRNIINLSNEIKFVRDPPQVMISFAEQRHDTLRFNIILSRVLTSKTRPLKEMSRRLPPKVYFVPERIANVGTVRKKYGKEANVFTLEVEHKLFLRQNHSIDLLKARQYVAKALEKMIGHFRDYNGGFLYEQSRQLSAIKAALGQQGKENEHLIDNLYYSLTPSILPTPEEVAHLCGLLLQTLELDLPMHDESLLKIEEHESSVVAVLKTNSLEVKDRSLKVDLSKITSATVEVDRHTYLCYLYLNPTPEETHQFTSTLKEWQKKHHEPQVLHLHLPLAAQSLDPRIGADRTSGIFIKMLYEGLMRINKRGEPENAIAESVTISEDKKTYLFKLRPSSWSNGTPLTAYDFEYAWKKILEPDFRSSYSFLFFPIKNGEAVKKGAVAISQLGVHVVDEHTLSIELQYPAPYFLELTASWVYSPLCHEIDQKHPGWAYHSGESYVCNGPFKLDVWKFNDDLQVVRNPLYWDANSVKLDRIEVSIIEDEATAIEMFNRGKLDWYGDPLSKFSLTTKEKIATTSDSKYYGLFWFQFNQERLPFQSTKIRKAFAYSANRERLIDEVLQSEETPAYGLLANEPFSADQALQLFEEGLEELGLDRKSLPPIVITHSDIEEQEKMSYALGAQWSALFDIEVKYERQPWHTYFETLNRGDFTLGGLIWFPRFQDPIYYFNLFIPRQYTIRISSWRNPDYIALVEGAHQTIDPKRREELLKKAEKIFLDEMPVIPLTYHPFHYAKNPRLKGFILSNTNQIDFRTAYLEKEAP